MPYDHTRVPINTPNGNDYINASLITLDLGNKLSLGSKSYIATQGPTPETIPHFWQLLLSHPISESKNHICVLMLTPLIENQRKSCAPYWPQTPEETMNFSADESYPNSISLTCKDSTSASEPIHHIRSTLVLKCNETGESRTIHHFYVDTWTDFDTPRLSHDMFKFIDVVNEIQTGMPLVVHCSAGVGRTGTYIVLDYMLTRSKLLAEGDSQGYDEGVDPIFDLVSDMRKQRIGMVQTLTQFSYLYNNVKAKVLGIEFKDLYN